MRHRSNPPHVVSIARAIALTIALAASGLLTTSCGNSEPPEESASTDAVEANAIPDRQPHSPTEPKQMPSVDRIARPSVELSIAETEPSGPLAHIENAAPSSQATSSGEESGWLPIRDLALAILAFATLTIFFTECITFVVMDWRA